LLQRPRSLAFVTEAIEKLDSVGIARTCRLEAGDSTAAIELGHNVASRWVGQAAGFDPEFGKFRPGYMLVEAILHTALDEGALEYDHGQGAREYKLHWATTQRVHRSVVVTHAGWRGEGQRLAQRFVASRRARRLLTGPVTGSSS
jgi:CelD/BcsL family acetyltransferase involved in cellulose biosynthesis